MAREHDRGTGRGGRALPGGRTQRTACRDPGTMRLLGVLLALALTAPGDIEAPVSPAGQWRAALDLAGGELRFGLRLQRHGAGLAGELCNGNRCQAFSAVLMRGDSLILEM